MATRPEVYAAIDTERAYQDAQWPEGSEPGPNQLSIGEFILLVEAYAADARDSYRKEHAPELGALGIMRKIAGIAVNCMEQHGAIPRA